MIMVKLFLGWIYDFLTDKVHVYFLGIIPLVIATAAAIFQKLMDFLTVIGISEEILLRQLIGFCSDGASCMIGQFQGVAKLFRDKIPHIKSFHCMAHRLELAVIRMRLTVLI